MSRKMLVVGLAAAATLSTVSSAQAQPVVTTNSLEVVVRTESRSEAALRVLTHDHEQVGGRIRLHVNRTPAVSGGCSILSSAAGDVVVDCPRRDVIEVEGTSSRDDISLGLAQWRNIRGRIYGNAGDDAIQGTGSNDSVYAGSGHDSVQGGTGDDALRGQTGADDLFGGPGDDVLQGGNEADLLNGGSGSDDLYARDIANPHTDDEWFNNDYFAAEDDTRDDIYCDSTPAWGFTPGVFDGIDENRGDMCRFA